MGTCFVIQPFDGGGAYDKRYEDVFVGAIKAAGLEPYRVDRDPSVSIPIEEIENQIKTSTLCLADITEDNPNVWYELGFAVASQKEVVLVCSESPSRRFPFDVHHRQITKYKTQSKRDFDTLEQEITERMQAILKKESLIDRIVSISPIVPTAGLSQHEMVALVTIGQNAFTPYGKVAVVDIRKDMEKAGFTQMATMLALHVLLQKQYATAETDEDYNGYQFPAYALTTAGLDWLSKNQGQLVLQHPKAEASGDPLSVDDIPFLMTRCSLPPPQGSTTCSEPTARSASA